MSTHVIEGHLLWPPILGQRSVKWETVFKLIRQPQFLWDCWKPSKSLDQYSLNELWACYNFGENVFDEHGVQIGAKPPLRIVEQHFKAEWRTGKLEGLKSVSIMCS